MSTVIVTESEYVLHGSLPGLALEINAAVGAAKTHAKSALDHVLKAGELLNQAKSHVSYGEWEVWLSANCSVAPRTARAYMKLAAATAAMPVEERQRVADLTLREAIKAMATTPETPPRIPRRQGVRVITPSSVEQVADTAIAPTSELPPGVPRPHGVRVTTPSGVKRVVKAFKTGADALRDCAKDIQGIHMLRGRQVQSLRAKVLAALHALDELESTDVQIVGPDGGQHGTD